MCQQVLQSPFHLHWNVLLFRWLSVASAASPRLARRKNEKKTDTKKNLSAHIRTHFAVANRTRNLERWSLLGDEFGAEPILIGDSSIACFQPIEGDEKNASFAATAADCFWDYFLFVQFLRAAHTRTILEKTPFRTAPPSSIFIGQELGRFDWSPKSSNFRLGARSRSDNANKLRLAIFLRSSKDCCFLFLSSLDSNGTPSNQTLCNYSSMDDLKFFTSRVCNIEYANKFF